jgi:hypothetical protein
MLLPITRALLRYDTTNIVKRQAEDEKDNEAKLNEKDPTAPVRSSVIFVSYHPATLTWGSSKAKSHGNAPSKGAKIDAELQAEEEAELKKKGKA